MKETHAGLLIPRVNKKICDFCKMCLKVCPGSHLESGIVKKEIDPFKGQILAAYCGFSTDNKIRRNAQSGGIATALLCYLLETGQIDKTLITQMTEDGTLRPKSYLTSNIDEILKAQGSKYCPVALNVCLPRTFNANESIALVGLPCHFHGVYNAQVNNPNWQKNNILTIGLFCDRTLTYGMIDYLIKKIGDDPNEIKTFRFRNKLRGDASFVNKDGIEFRIPNKYRINAKDIFTPLRCRLCFDKLNILSDLSIGDAWGIKEDNNGFSVLLARTQRGLNVILSALNAGVLDLEKISPEAVFKAQGIELRRSCWETYTTIWKKWERPAPNFHIPKCFSSVQQTGFAIRQERSHLRWAIKLASQKTSQAALRASIRRERMNYIRAKISPKKILKILYTFIKMP